MLAVDLMQLFDYQAPMQRPNTATASLRGNLDCVKINSVLLIIQRWACLYADSYMAIKNIIIISLAYSQLHSSLHSCSHVAMC